MKKLINTNAISLIIILILFLIVEKLNTTYALFNYEYTDNKEIVELPLTFNVKISQIEEYDKVNIAASSHKIINIEVKNNSPINDEKTLYYGIWYRLNNSLMNNNNMIIAKYEKSISSTNGSIESDETKLVTIIIINNGSEDIELDIGVSSNETNVNDIEYLSGKRLVSGVAGIPTFDGNSPNLDNNNLIPVYYDETDEKWKKADSENTDNSWYSYKNKMWANAVIVEESTKISYQNANINTVINDSDIIAFYVWIPRYKYRVWNINRQASGEDGYAYNAFSNGIEIKFEEGIETTGNVTCNYDITSIESDSNLSDKCYYYDDEITTASINKNYTNAWYTHPAFTFGNLDIEGFWIGKFETSGNISNPLIIPDNLSITGQNLSSLFTISKKFQNYLSNNIDAHLLTSLEWGAVSYLTHSNYGLCNDNICRDVYINNSSSYYTGRSGGAPSGSDELTLTNVYGTGGNNKYNAYAYYNYKGYKLNRADGTTTDTKDISKIASTTGNITGVYDTSGGSVDYVMSNMVNKDGAFYTSSAGTNWNNNTILDNMYYMAYSYGANYINQTGFNRARLGDATAEILASATNSGSWSTNITGGLSQFIAYYLYSGYSYFGRGGYSEIEQAGIFSFYRYTGSSASNVGSRSSLT